MTATPTTENADPPRDAAPPPATPTAPASTHDRHFRTDHLMADLKGRSVRGGAVTLSAQAVKFVLQTGSTMVLARLLTPADFGLIAMVSAFTGFVSLFKDLGLSMATIQRPEITHAQVSTLFWINVALSLALAVVAAALAPAVAWFYGEPQLTWITIAIAATFIFGGLSTQHTALLRRQMRFKALALIEVGALVAGVATAITLAWYTRSYWALVAMTATQAATTAAMSFAASGWVPGKPQKRAGTRAMLKFGGNLTGFNVANYFRRNADNLLLGKVWGADVLGLYTKAYGLLMLPIRQINGPVTSVALPTLSRLSSDPDRYRRNYRAALSLLAAASIPLTTFAFVASAPLINILLGDQWGAASTLFRALAIAALVDSLNVMTGWVYISLDQTARQLRWGLFQTLVFVVGFTYALQWGALGVALAYSALSILLRGPAVLYCFAGTFMKVSDVVLPIWRPAAASIAAGTIVTRLNHVLTFRWNPYAELALSLVGFTIAYGALWCALPNGIERARDLFSIRHQFRTS